MSTQKGMLKKNCQNKVLLLTEYQTRWCLQNNVHLCIEYLCNVHICREYQNNIHMYAKDGKSMSTYNPITLNKVNTCACMQ